MPSEPPDRLRVLWLTKGLGPGGAERLLVSFAAKADRDRFDLYAAYLLPWKDHLVTALEGLGVEVTCLDGRREIDVRWVARLRHLLKAKRIDVVHVHSPVASAAARLAVRTLPRRERPVVVGTEHNVWTSHHPLTRWANRLTMGLQSATIAVSDEVRDSMSPSRAARAEVVVHGVDVGALVERRAEREAARSALGVEVGDLVVVTVANLRANKDYPTLLLAASRVLAEDASFRFFSVGQGPLASDLERARIQADLGDRFTFLGYREDPIAVLAAADIFCLSSRYEGLPIAMLEALALGVPIVATRVGGVPTAITDGVHGRLVDAGDDRALADALLDLADAGERARCGEEAAARATAFDITRAVEHQQELYLSLVGSRR